MLCSKVATVVAHNAQLLLTLELKSNCNFMCTVNKLHLTVTSK